MVNANKANVAWNALDLMFPPCVNSGFECRYASLLRPLWRNGVCPPVGTILVNEASRRRRCVRDLNHVRAVGICCVDFLLTVEEHAENNPRPIWGPVGLEGEILLGAGLELDRSEPGAVNTDDEQP